MRLIANSTSDSVIVTDVKQLLSLTISGQPGKFLLSTIPTKAKYLLNLLNSSFLHGADTWTILKADGKKLQVFYMQSQSRILGIQWSYL